MAVHASLNQRIVVRQHLAGLGREELEPYLRLAGCELPLPEPEALHQASRGLPRQVNRLAHYALAAAALEQARTVTAAPVECARPGVAAAGRARALEPLAAALGYRRGAPLRPRSAPVLLQ